MTTYYLNGQQIPEGSDITLNGFTYPYSWLEGTSAYVRASHGIEATGDVTYDPRYYWDKDIPKNLEDKEEVDKDGNPLYVKILGEVDGQPAMVDSDKRLITLGLKTTCTSQVKSTTNDLLKSTDHYIIRNSVDGSEIPESVSTYRSAVITESNRVTDVLAAVTSIEELITTMNSISWPETK